ncbi:hypothetical protein ACFSCX_19200 [Bacillus salitolerans]|uniref:Uncharacterized protein n=1 Tax=Bacillus salitolerans TaxID=1437434 RepID=A0ABW4LUU2_9BACI
MEGFDIRNKWKYELDKEELIELDHQGIIKKGWSEYINQGNYQTKWCNA